MDESAFRQRWAREGIQWKRKLSAPFDKFNFQVYESKIQREASS